MRGTLETDDFHNARGRFIPARAGNTVTQDYRERNQAVHPRACGEHICCRNTFNLPIGSSPRVRGTHCMLWKTQRSKRFIPARAGNTPGGEDNLVMEYGSSPRVRGTPLSGQVLTLSGPVHPRAGGEHILAAILNMRAYGSSPRVRGTHVRGTGPARVYRFIPARAGNTSHASLMARRIAVHPRACGEHYNFRVDHNFGTGSSPRGRGTLSSHVNPILCKRFIPARAGNTSRQG